MELLLPGVGVAEHRLEVIAALVAGARQHQLLIQKPLARPPGPAFARPRVDAPGGECQQVQGAAQQIQVQRSQQPLQLAAATNRPIHHALDALKSQLAQTQPQLQDLTGATALQTTFAAMGVPPAGLHVGKAGGEGGLKLLGLAQQQQGGGLVDAQ